MVTINNQQYLTVHEFAKEKRITIQTVYNWIRDKKVETKKIRNTGNMEIDHIKPHSKHKDGSKENLCLSCKRCNRLKSNHTIEEFRNISLNLCNGIVINDLFYFEIKGIWKGI